MIVGLICATGLVIVTWRWIKVWFHWSVRGIPTYGYPPPIGCLLPIWTGRLSICELTDEVFKKNPKSKIIGSWILFNPILIIKDPQIVHQILYEDFTSWPDRGFKDDPNLDPLSQHIINIGGNRWKIVRSWLSSGLGMIGLKNRHDIFLQEAERFARLMTASAKVDVVETTKESMFDILTRIALGTRDVDPMVRKLTLEAFSGSFWTTLRSAFRLSCPKILSSVNCKRFQSDHVRSFMNIVDERSRTVNCSVNNQDMLQLLIDSYNQYLKSDVKNREISYEVIASNAFAILAAGYDTTASTMAWIFLELAKNSEVQDKLHEEIHRVLAVHGEPNYLAIKDLRYMDKVISEGLRMYPSVTITSRVSVAPTILDNINIPSGTRVVVPIYSIQRYPGYFPDAEVFNPERFSTGDVNMMAILPYGKGPHICIGRRLAELTLKLAITMVIKDFSLSVAPETKQPVGYATNSLFLEPKTSIILNLHPRN